MYVVKRDGHKEPVMFDKITDRIKKLCYGLNDMVDAVKVAMRVIEGLYDGVTRLFRCFNDENVFHFTKIKKFLLYRIKK